MELHTKTNLGLSVPNATDARQAPPAPVNTTRKSLAIAQPLTSSSDLKRGINFIETITKGIRSHVRRGQGTNQNLLDRA